MIKATYYNLKNKSNKLIDIDVFFSIANYSWTILKSPLSLIFITRYLSVTEQGYWYTFLSLGTLTVFAEMGFTNIITQFVSHEFANLKINKNNTVSGKEENIDRFISLIRFSLKKYLLIIPSGILIILLISFIFFKKELFNSEILIVWLFFAFSGGLSLFISMLSSVFLGLNKVTTTLKITFFTNIIGTSIIWLSLIYGFGLWALSISAFIVFFITIIIFFIIFRHLFFQILSRKIEKSFSWKREVYPLQIKYSISWISGYFIFNFIVPVTMYFLGAIEAGKVGITMAVAGALLQMAHSWVSTKTPYFNMLISKGKIQNSKLLFKKRNYHSVLFFSVSSLLFIITFYFGFFDYFIPNFTKKFLNINCIILILLAEFCKLLLGNWAIYLRAYKVEPYLKITIINSILTVIAFLVALSILKSLIISLFLFLFIQIITLFLGYKIYKPKVSSL